MDRQAEDLLFGEAGDDRFQLIPDRLPVIPGTTQTLIPTLTDRFDGGEGFDEVLFLGGDLDAAGRPVPDFVAFKYNTVLHRYEFTALVWDVANQRFLPDPANPQASVQTFVFYQTHNVERTVIDTRSGDDEVHANPGFTFPHALGTWGIAAGAFQQQASLAALTLRGGAGQDRLFGGAMGDDIDGGSGIDFILGGGGDDLIRGGDGADLLQGDGTPATGDLGATAPDRFEFGTRDGVLGRNDDFRFSRLISGVTGGQVLADLSFHLGDDEDWYLIKTPESFRQFGATRTAFLAESMISVVFDTPPAVAFDPERDLELFAARDTDPGAGLAVELVDFFEGVPEYYLLQVRNPLDVLSDGSSTPGPRPAAGRYALQFSAAVGPTVDVPADGEDAFTIGSVNLASQPAVIPLGNFFGATSPAAAVYPDFIAAIREDMTAQESVVYLYQGGPAPGDFVINANTPALKLPGLILSGTGTRRAFFASPGDYNKDGRQDLAVAISRLPGGGAVAKEAVYILFGRATPWVGELDLVASADVVISGLTGAASVANAGDLNGDVIDDLVIGDQGANFAAVILGRTNWGSAATPVFAADFSSGANPSLDGFVIDNAVPADAPPTQVPGLWHQTTRRGTEPGHSTTHSLYFGVDATGNYNVGHTAGRVTSPVINLAGLSGAELAFNQVLLTEGGTAFDTAEVQISTDGVNFTTIMSRGNGLLENSSSWTSASFNLQSFIGQSIRLRFVFDTIDSGENQSEGWYVDDVVVRSFLTVANPDIKFTGPAGTGASVAGVGDVDGDTRADLAVLRAGTGSDGRVSFVFGRALNNPFPATTTLDAVAGSTLTTSNLDFTGFQVRAAGDVDHDGRLDVLVSGTSSSYLVRGRALATSVALGTVGLPIPAGGVVGIGNVDGDDYDDLGVSVLEPGALDRLHQVEWIFLGGPAAGLSFTTPALVIEPASAEYLDGAQRRVRPHAIAGIGDLSKDTVGDFAVAERIGTRTRVFFGKALSTPVPVLPGDATPEPFRFDLAPPLLPGSVPASPVFGLPTSPSGPVSVSVAPGLEGAYAGETLSESYPLGDVNGDGFDDLLIRGPGFLTPGSLRLLFGPIELNGSASAADWGDVVFEASLLGQPARSMGDIDGDGATDLVFTKASISGSTATAVVTIIFGRQTMPRTVNAQSLAMLNTQTITIMHSVANPDFETHVLNWNGDREDDVFVRTPGQGLLFSGATIMARDKAGVGVVGADRLFSVAHVNPLDFPFRGIVAGDVNGDGLDDLLFREELASDGTSDGSKRVYLLAGRPDQRLGGSSLNLSQDADGRITFTEPVLGGTKGELGVWRLGDFNRDGYDDFGVTWNLEVEGPDQASLYIFYGSADYAAGGIQRLLSAADAGVAIARQLPGQLSGGLGLGSFPSVTAGDFNDDGRQDLALGDPLIGLLAPGGQFLNDTRGRVAIFYSLAARGSRLNLSQADVVLEGEQATDVLGGLPTRPNVDVNRDGADDLLVGASFASVVGDTIQNLAGKIYFLYGAPLVDARVAANQNTATVLTNRTVTGSGDFLVGQGPGQNFVQTGSLATGAGEIWYRFTTLGDGEPGTQILLTPSAEGPRAVLLRGQDGRINAAGQVQLGDLLTLGGEVGEAVVIEFDLAGYLDRVLDVDSIQQALLLLDAAVNLPLLETGSRLVFVNNQIFFQAHDRANPYNTELWKSDATVWGSTQVRDIAPSFFAVGPDQFAAGSNPQNLTSVGSTLFFTAADTTTTGQAVNGVELWKSDGTAAGTMLVKNINSGASNSDPGNLTNVNGILYFSAFDFSNGVELWKSDGTTAGTVMLSNNLGTNGSNPRNLTNVNGMLYFSATGFADGEELWRSDGTGAGTIRVQNINPGPLGGSAPSNLTNVNGVLFFSANDGSTGAELWRSDGTSAGTVPVHNINITPTSAASSSPANLVNVNGTLYFTADDGMNGREVWRSNGTAAGTVRLASVNAAFVGLANASQFTAIGNLLYFTAFTAASGLELYRYDTATNNLQRLTNIAAGAATSDPQELTVIGTTLFFNATPGTGRRELWKTNGTPGTTVLVSNNAGAGYQSADSRSGRLNLATNGTTLAFSARNAAGEVELWLSNGTTAGTLRLADAGLVDRTAQVRSLDDEGDGAVTASDRTATASLAAPFIPLRNSPGSRPVQIDVSNLVRDALLSGQTRLTLRLQLDSPIASGPQFIHSSTNPLKQTGLQITTAARTGVVADVFDGEGRMIGAGQSLIDLRTFDAGTYYLRVFNPAGAGQSGPLPFVIEAVAPKAGASHPLTDRDEIRGGDGDDILVGNRHADRLFGEGGDDDFIAEDTEVRDLEIRGLGTAEFRRLPQLEEEKIVRSQGLLRPLNPALDEYFHDDALRLALARALGLPITTSYRGVPFAREPITAVQMASLSRLDLNGLGLADVSGLEFATNLSLLNLAGNELVDLAVLAPHTVRTGVAGGQEAGLAHLEYLGLDFTPLVNAGRLADFTQLRALSADGRPVAPPAAPPNPFSVQLAKPNGATAYYFGASVAAFGNFVLVGAPSSGLSADPGAAYLFDATSGQLVRPLSNPNPNPFDYFGASVALSGEFIVVGAPADDPFGVSNGGAVYVFDLQTGALVQTLTKPGATSDDAFGTAVAVAGDIIIVGAPNTFGTPGTAHLFDARTGALLRTLLNPTPLNGERFGAAVAIEGDTVVVGAPGAGEAYVFNWRVEQPPVTLANPAPASFLSFARAVALSGNRVLVGAPGDVLSFTIPGAAFLFDTAGGAPLRTIPTPAGFGGPGFGTSVALRGPAALIGAATTPLVGGFNDGAAYLFDLTGAESRLLRQYSNPTSVGGDGFGFTAALSGGTVYVGSPGEDRVYLYEGLRLTDASPLAGLQGLRFLSLSRNQLPNVGPLTGLAQLRWLQLDSNRIADISPLVGRPIIDDGGAGFTASGPWQTNVQPVTGAFGEDYRFLPGAGPNAPSPQTAEWVVTQLAPGAYNVLVTWPAAESRATDVPYLVLDDTALLATVTVNQKFNPSGAVLGGRPWQSLGIFQVGSGTLRVRLTNAAPANTLVAADAVRIVPADAATGQDRALMPSLSVLNLRGNPLDNDAHDFHLGVLQTQLGAGLSFEADAAPVLQVGVLRDGPSRALQFDGLDDYVEIPNSASLDLRRTITVEFWFRVDSQADGTLAFPAGRNWMPLVQKSTGTAGARTYGVWLNRAGFLELDSTDTTGTQILQTPAAVIQPNQWYHVAGVINRNVGAGTLQLLVHNLSGALANSTAVVVRTTDTVSTSTPLELGRTLEFAADHTPFKGALDDVRVWSTARTQAQVEAALFNRLAGTETGLSGYWRFDEATGSSVLDATANANHGFLGGASTPVPAAGPGAAANVARFDGVDDYIISPNLRNQFTNETVTLELWFNAQGPGVMVDELGSTNINNRLWNDSQLEILATGQVLARVWNLPAVTLGQVSFGIWNHAVLRYNRTALVLDGFLNGVKSASVSGDRQAPWEFSVNAIHYALGLTDTNTNLGSGAFFKGQIDEFRVWNVARTDAEIQADRRAPLGGTEPGLVMYWRLDTFLFDFTFFNFSTPDQSGRGGSGTAVNGALTGATAPLRIYPLIATDADNATLFLTAASDLPAVTPVVQSGNLLLNLAPDLAGTATLTVRSADRELGGRTDEVRFDLTAGANAVYGTKFSDTNRNGVRDAGEPPVEGVAIFLDANGNLTLDSGETVSYTDLNGQYALTDLTPAASTQTVFATDFNSGVPAQFSGVTTAEPVQGFGTVANPNGATFSGNFLRIATGGTPTAQATLTLTGLAAHASLDLSFLLAMIDSWDGTGSAQPEVFNVTVDGQPILSSTFTNVNQAGFGQGYAPTVPGVDLTPGFTEIAFAVFANVGDSAYNLALEPRFRNIPHTANSVTIRWFASGNGVEPIVNESWAIDNVQVTLNSVTAPTLSVVEQPPEGWRPTTGTVPVGGGGQLAGRRQLTPQPGGQVFEGVDFANVRVANAGADRTVTENTAVAFTGTVTDPNPANGANFTLAWTALAPGGATAATGSGANFNFTPRDDGIFTVLFTVTDLDDASRVYQDRVFVVVTNVAPNLAAGGNASLAEGATFARSVSFTDPGQDVWTAAVDYGDGTPVEHRTGLAAGTAFNLNHRYLDNGQFVVAVTVADGDGGFSTRSFTLTVTNAAPVVNAGADQTVSEGTTVSLAATVNDPGPLDTHTYRWSVVASNGQIVPLGAAPDFTFVPVDQGTYTVSLTVTDNNGAGAGDTVVITVTDTAPTGAPQGPDAIDEGALYTLVVGPAIDPGADTVTQYRINWGDGTPVQVFTPEQINALERTLTHIYANEGIRVLTVTMVDEEGSHVAGTLTVTVRNVAAVVTGLTVSATTLAENGVLTLAGTLADPGVLDGHTIKILWGDGTPEQTLVLAPGTLEFSTTHRYLDDAPSGTVTDPATITVRANDGTVDSAPLTTKVTLSNVAPSFTTLTVPAAVTEGNSLALNGTLTDAGSLDSQSVRVDWGDGTPVQTLTLSPAKAFAGSHVYPIPGTYQVVVTASDDDGGVAVEARPVVVDDLAPAIASANFGVVGVGTLFVRTGTFADASGPEDSWTATVRYDTGPTVPLPLNPDKSFVLQQVFGTLGSHAITVSVADRFGRSAVRTFAVDVQNIGPGPAVLGIQVNGGGSQRARWSGATVQFSKNVGATVSLADVVLRSLTTGTTVAPANLTLGYNSTANVLTIGLASGVVLPAGDYRLTVLAAGITDTGGQPLPANALVDFHVLPGDINGDRRVNDLDLFAAWQNSLKPLAQQNLNADLTGDGRVTAADIQVVKTLYLTAVPSPSLPEAAVPDYASGAAVSSWGEGESDASGDGLVTESAAAFSSAETSRVAAPAGVLPSPNDLASGTAGGSLSGAAPGAEGAGATLRVDRDTPVASAPAGIRVTPAPAGTAGGVAFEGHAGLPMQVAAQADRGLGRLVSLASPGRSDTGVPALFQGSGSFRSFYGDPFLGRIGLDWATAIADWDRPIRWPRMSWGPKGDAVRITSATFGTRGA